MLGKTGVFAVIPVKLLSDSKSRLSGILNPEQRRILTLFMLEDVLAAIRSSALVERILVVTPDVQVIRFAQGLSVESIESSFGDLNRDLEFALESCKVNQLGSALIVLADLPTLSVSDLRNIIETCLGNPSGVISPSGDGGTNVLLLHPCDLIRPNFGLGSFERHMEELRSKGSEVSVYRSEGTLLDIDSPKDVYKLLRRSSNSSPLKSLNYIQTIISK
jgi:2-phospho-L-lactate guanylyltransferase